MTEEKKINEIIDDSDVFDFLRGQAEIISSNSDDCEEDEYLLIRISGVFILKRCIAMNYKHVFVFSREEDAQKEFRDLVADEEAHHVHNLI